MDHKQQQSLNEAIMQQVFGYSPSPPSSSSTSSIDEDNTAAVAKQVKKAVKEYTSGKLVVRSKGGKSRFIMVRADKIDNKLREMMADVMYPKANIHDRDDISYGNISSMIISAGTDAWIEALGLKEEEEAATELDEAFDMKKMLKIFNKLKKNDTIKIKYDSSISKGKEFQTFVVTSPKRTVGKRGVERVIMKHVNNPTGVKYTLYNRDGSVSLAIGDMAASMTDIKESADHVEHDLDEASRPMQFPGAMSGGKMKGKFTSAQLKQLKDAYGKIGRVDPSSKTYEKLTAFLDAQDKNVLQQLANARIQFISSLALNRVNRLKMKGS